MNPDAIQQVPPQPLYFAVFSLYSRLKQVRTRSSPSPCEFPLLRHCRGGQGLELVTTDSRCTGWLYAPIGPWAAPSARMAREIGITHRQICTPIIRCSSIAVL